RTSRFQRLSDSQQAVKTARLALRFLCTGLKAGVTGTSIFLSRLLYRARLVRARARRFRQESFARRRWDECHRLNSTRDRLPRPRVNRAPTPLHFWRRVHRIFFQMPTRSRPPCRVAVAGLARAALSQLGLLRCRGSSINQALGAKRPSKSEGSG